MNSKKILSWFTVPKPKASNGLELGKFAAFVFFPIAVAVIFGPKAYLQRDELIDKKRETDPDAITRYK